MTSEQHDGPGSPADGRPGLGRGLVAGLATTARAMVRHTHTAEYPDVRPDLPPRSRGVIALLAENCTSCMLCARECPDWCIYIESHKEEVLVPGPGDSPPKTRQKNMLDRFAIDFSLCMYCGICIEVCPFDALFWSPEFEYAEFDIRDLLHESDRLESWMASVPPPPLPDPAAVEAKEVGVARAAAEKAIAAYEATQVEARAREAERLDAERAEAERQERLDAERQERLDAERQDGERAEAERRETERTRKIEGLAAEEEAPREEPAMYPADQETQKMAPVTTDQTKMLPPVTDDEIEDEIEDGEPPRKDAP